MSKFQIINIEGAVGIGKSAQVNLLRLYLKERNKNSITQGLGYSIPQALELIDNTTKFLEINPNGIVINDGSIARIIIQDLVSGLSREQVIQKNVDIIHDYEVMNHRFNTANILLLPQNMEMCQKWVDKRQHLFGLESKTVDLDTERDILKGLSTFENNMINLSINFKVVIVGEKDSMLDIHKEILDILGGK